MKPMKKNKFFTFIFSLLPGAGEMYMGFMKAGISLMLLFFAIFSLTFMLNTSVLMCFLVVIWFYGFFHTNHLSGLNDADFEKIEDTYLFGFDVLSQGKASVEKYRKIFACILIGLGILLLWNMVMESLVSIRGLNDEIRQLIWHIESAVPQLFMGILVIVAGIKMIKGKKAMLFADESGEKAETDEKDS